MNAATYQVAFKFRDLAQNSSYSAGLQKPMTRSTPERLYQLRSKQNDLAGSRQMLDKALEIPLAAFDLAWFFQRYDACAARVEMLHESLDRAPLACRVASLEQQDQPLTGIL